MTPEQRNQRRGEPVKYRGKDATIEWGDMEHGFSLYTERDGVSTGREQVLRGDAHLVEPDPGASRPVWDSVTKRSR